MRESAVRLVAWIYEIRTITGRNFGTYFAPKNDFILEALPRILADIARTIARPSRSRVHATAILADIIARTLAVPRALVCAKRPFSRKMTLSSARNGYFGGH